MSRWVNGINAVILKLDHADRALVPALGAAVHNSVVHGSPITSAPGQVVADEDGGNLRDSWQLEFPDADHAMTYTKTVYAQSNEDGVARPGGGPYIQRSAIGGRWNVELTRLHWQRLVDHVVAGGIRLDGSPAGGA